MHRPTIIFLLSHKTQPFNKKQPPGTINQIKQSEKTIQNLSIKNALKTKHYNKHNNPSRHTPIFLNIKIIAG